METLAKIQEIIAVTLGIPLAQVHAETKAADFVEWDAMRQFQIVAEIEEAFGFKFGAQELAELDSVEKLVKAVQERATTAYSQRSTADPDTIIEVLKTVRPECNFAGVDDFFVRGVLDSLDLTLLVSALEDRLDIAINGLDIVPDNFRNVDAIMALATKYGVASAQ